MMRLALGVMALTLAACTSDYFAEDAVGYPWTLPSGFPLPIVPADNPITAEKTLLGRYLFYDTRLSVNGQYSCGMCHQQSHAFSSPIALPYGCTGQQIRRNAMSLTNVAYNAGYTWANPNLRTLEQQILIPMFSEVPVELGLADQDALIEVRFTSDTHYAALFHAAFPSSGAPVTMGNIELAIATFERTLISSNAPYDQAVAGNTSAMSASAQRGQALFFGERMDCYHCHGGFNFADATTHTGLQFDQLVFHNTGLYNLGGTGAYPASDQGLIEITGVATDMGRFRAPTLRNIALTAPYFHDGSAATLDDVIAHYAAGGRTIASGPNAGDGATSRYKDSLVHGFTLSDQEHADAIAFLESLTDTTFINDPRLANPFIASNGGAGSASCPQDFPTSCPSPVPSFAADVWPVIQQRCTNCHVMGGPGGTWPLTTHTEVAVMQSAVTMQLTGCAMPPDEATPLTSTERQTLLRWLACNAPDN